LMDGSKFAESLSASGPTDSGPRCLVNLTNVTAVSASPLFHLRVPNSLPLKSLLPLKPQLSDCLLTPLGNKPILLLAGLETGLNNDSELRERFAWEPGRNLYGSYMSFIEQQITNAQKMMVEPFDR